MIKFSENTVLNFKIEPDDNEKTLNAKDSFEFDKNIPCPSKISRYFVIQLCEIK